MYFFIAPIRALLETFRANDSARQIAFAVAMGVIIGLVPKGNLIAWTLIFLLFSLRINHGVAMATAFLFTWIGMLLDPVLHTIGMCVLKLEVLEPLFVWLYNLPVVPWTSFNNTVVMGSFLLGIALAVPIYFGTKQIHEKYGESAVNYLGKYRIFQFLAGTELATRWKMS